MAVGLRLEDDKDCFLAIMSKLFDHNHPMMSYAREGAFQDQRQSRGITLTLLGAPWWHHRSG